MGTSSDAARLSATTGRSELGITSWPAQPLPLPDVDLPALEVVNGANGVWFYLRPTARTVDLPADFYLREPREVDLGDLGAVAAFVGAWGRFSDAPTDRDLPFGVSGTWSGGVEQNARARGWLPPRWHLGDHRQAAGEKLGLDPLQTVLRLINPAEVVVRLEKLSAMADWVERWQRGGDIDAPWPPFGWEPGRVILRDYLNAALSAFQVRVEVMGEPDPAAQPATAYSVAALQLWNDLHEATWRSCDMCERLFTRQRGRGRHYSHTEGVRFCTRRCANLHTQRDYRRRQKAKKGTTT